VVPAIADVPSSADGGASASGKHESSAGEVKADAEYFEHVLLEIDQEVRHRRAAGDLPARVERELDDLFLAFAPGGGGRTGEVSESLRMVDASAFINPVVPVESDRSGGAAIKRSIRSLTLWYMGFITQQINQFTSSVSRCLHIVERRLTDLETEIAAMRQESPPVVDVPWAHGANAWWVPTVLEALRDAPDRVLHAACGNGWLVQALARSGIDAYGVDPRTNAIELPPPDGAELLDLRNEALDEHLHAVGLACLGGIVLTGLTESRSLPQIKLLLDLVDDVVSPEGVVAIHSLSPSWWMSADGPVAADLVTGHPLRGRTWEHLLAERGFEATVHHDPNAADGTPGEEGSAIGQQARDYLVIARRPTLPGPGDAP